LLCALLSHDASWRTYEPDRSMTAAALAAHSGDRTLILSPFAIVGCLKGRYALSIVGLVVLFGIPAILAGTRVARSDFWWARRFYEEDKLARAAHRYPGNSRLSDALTL
jgi:hypothetical protein